MQVLGSRRGGLLTLAIAAAALVIAVAFAVWQLVDRPDVDAPAPRPGSEVHDALTPIAFRVPHGARLGSLRVRLDGRDVTSRVRGAGDRVVLTPAARLADGVHRVEVSFRSRNVFARSVDQRWSFVVDTSPPALALAAPARGALIGRHAADFRGTAEPGARVSVAAGARAVEVVAAASGAWHAVAQLPEGRVAATVTAIDAAGNTTVRRRALTVDTTPPVVALVRPVAGQRITATDAPALVGRVPSDDPSELTFTASVNGRTVATVKGADAATTASITASYGHAAAMPIDLQIDGRRFAMAVGKLPQGRSSIAVRVRDRAGNATVVRRDVFVDSTEEFGTADIGPDARGADVVALQQRLREAHVLGRRARRGLVDARTIRAIRRYQARFGLPVTGIVDARTRARMIGRIVVNISQRKLRLIRNGRVVRTYAIAVGQPAYPTPTGDFAINDKQKNPAWTPPNSPWAKELSTIPPGPGNPLGTRWIGTTAPAIGIHGTYADSSIGTAASHGCMRMHIKDVEALYDQVAIGMPLSIRS